jgi:hypothetical protein
MGWDECQRAGEVQCLVNPREAGKRKGRLCGRPLLLVENWLPAEELL